MPLILKDRVKETSVTSGTGTLTLTGAPQSFQTFSNAIGNGNTTYYAITEQGTANFEVGLGTVAAGTLSRDTVLESSNANSLVNFGSATKDVFCTYPAEKAILGDTSAIASTGTGNVVLSDSPTITTALTATGALQLTGSATVNQNIATTQTTGTLTIGGTTSTGAINIGRSTGAQSINIVSSNASTSVINIGGATTSSGSINVGRSTGAQTVQMATGATGSGVTKTVNIGTNGVSGSTTTITVGSVTGTCTTTVNGTIRQQTYTVATLPAGIAGAMSFVTDALSPTFGATVVGGGAVGVPVYHDGTSWKVG